MRSFGFQIVSARCREIETRAQQIAAEQSSERHPVKPSADAIEKRAP